MTSKESRVQNKEEIQGGRSCFLPGKVPAAIWLRGLFFKPLDCLFFRSLQLIIFINALQPTVLAPLAENLYSQCVLLAGFTVPLAGNQQRRSSLVNK